MTSGVNMLCFSASYALAFALTLIGVWRRFPWRRLAAGCIALAGLIAHTLYLGKRAVESPASPLSSPHDWYLLAAWTLAAIFLAAAVYYPGRSMALFLMPPTLGLILAARFASTQPLASFSASRFWGRFHGATLGVGTVAVLVGFAAGVMYLLQSHRLKHKLLADERLRLPSLEWLDRVNGRALTVAMALVVLGFFSGLLVRLSEQGAGGVPWTDPVVLSLGAMAAWLVGAEAFRRLYPAARQGRKVAYLTVAALGFLVITLAAFAGSNTVHGQTSSGAGSAAGGSA
jgi:ABC-type uncharacterized transport system permease subunit